MRRIGVFICHCGINIASTVDVESLAETLLACPGVAHAATYKYMCSDPGQLMVREAIRERGLDGVIIAACSPAMHETTFRRTAASAGLNPYLLECANIREQCSWVHTKDPKGATEKALATILAMVEKAKRNESLDVPGLPLTKKALVIGGGVAGLTATLDIAAAGYPVILVEREAGLGGHVAGLCGSYLNVRAPGPLLDEPVRRVLAEPNVQVLTGAEVRQLDGYIGNFRASLCWKDGASGNRVEGTFDVGAVVVATGFGRYSLARLPEYGGGTLPDVIDGLAFEAMLASGELRRPSDGKAPREVVFVQCAGSRDPQHGVSFCSKVCCMYVAKQAALFKERAPEGQAYVFYLDIRSAGLNYDEYVQRAMSEQRVIYLRGKVSRLFQDGDKVMVWGCDTLSGRAVEILADLVVLATPMVAAPGAAELARLLHISANADGFYNEAHPKLRPVESLTAGIFLAGAGQGPKDIPETASQAGAAAAKVLQMFSHADIKGEATIAQVADDLCAACGLCAMACPYGARSLDEVWHVATVNAALCQGCGACAAVCPNKATWVCNWTPAQVLRMADVMT